MCRSWSTFLTLLTVLFMGPGCLDYDVSRHKEREAFDQPGRDGGVDILWVIDDSMSMYEEQEQLSTHSASFIGFLTTVSVDFHLGVITTDMDADQAGRLHGEVLSSETSGLMEAFASLVTDSIDGSRDERGFEAAIDGCDASINPGFVRDDADLEIIFFSDEDDHSGMDSEDFISDLEAMRPDSIVTVNSIVGDLPEGCASILAAADPGEKYVEAQEFTEGLRESICSFDYDAMLSRVAQHVIGLNVRFALMKIPDLDTVEVKVDGIIIHHRDRHGWWYDAGDNTIVFDGYAVPPPGSSIVITYYEWQGMDAPLDTGQAE
jgi:hypothetical protein